MASRDGKSGGGVGNACLMSAGISFWSYGNVLELDVSSDCTTLECT